MERPRDTISTSQSRDPEEIELVVLENGLIATSTPLPQSPRLPWHPKITPYRLLTFLIPIVLGTIKAIATQKGSISEPITLEWISGVVIFLVLFNTGTYENRPIHHIPWHFSWLFKPDCMDALWWLRKQLFGTPRPRYNSEESTGGDSGPVYVVTSYRLLVSSTVCSIGMLKASLTYAGVSTGATWVEWLLGVVVSSILYTVGLYECNSSGLWPSFFGTDRAYVVRSGLTGTSKLLFIAVSLTLMSLWFAIERPKDGYTEAELPLVLRAYNKSVQIMLESVFIFLFILGAVVLFASLRSARDDLGDNMPRRVQVFLERAEIFMNGAPHRALLWVQSYAYRIRHLLALVICIAINVVFHSFAFGYMYRAGIGDISALATRRNWNPFVYFSLSLVSLVPILPSFFILRWAGRGLLVSMRRALEAGAVNVIIALVGLRRANAHYAFTELVDALRGSVA